MPERKQGLLLLLAQLQPSTVSAPQKGFNTWTCCHGWEEQANCDMGQLVSSLYRGHFFFQFPFLSHSLKVSSFLSYPVPQPSSHFQWEPQNWQENGRTGRRTEEVAHSSVWRYGKNTLKKRKKLNFKNEINELSLGLKHEKGKLKINRHQRLLFLLQKCRMLWATDNSEKLWVAAFKQ